MCGEQNEHLSVVNVTDFKSSAASSDALMKRREAVLEGNRVPFGRLQIGLAIQASTAVEG